MSWFLNLIILFFACNGGPLTSADSQKEKETAVALKHSTYKFPYQINDPSHSLTLPKILEEISGLGLTNSGNLLIAVQDEKGIVFFIDKERGTIELELAFWKDGDYEGVEAIGQELFAVKSSGTLYHFNDGGGEVTKYNGFLTKENEVEGLCYDSKNNQLLIACKGKAGDGRKYDLKKGIYSFDLEKKEFSKSPIYTISLEAIHDYLGTSPSIRKLEEIIEFFQPDKSELTFAPSAIAIHPISDDIYITSAVGNLLLVLGRNGEIKHIEKLKKKVHLQPEGICFSPDGTLFIANEGNNGNGYIHRFNYRSN